MKFVCPHCAMNVLRLSKDERMEFSLSLKNYPDGLYVCHSCEDQFLLETDKHGFKKVK
jgi:uncharacterized protein YlaI